MAEPSDAELIELMGTWETAPYSLRVKFPSGKYLTLFVSQYELDNYIHTDEQMAKALKCKFEVAIEMMREEGLLPYPAEDVVDGN